MLVKEVRITMPMSAEEFRRGQLYSCSKTSILETGGGEGVQILEDRPFKGKPMFNGMYNSGRYTKKIYHLESKAPGWIQKLAPKGALKLHEECWDSYPYTRTVSTNPDYMKQDFEARTETLVVDNDRGELHNVHHLGADLLSQREVVYIDIAHDAIEKADYKLEEDPKLFTSKKTGRGPLNSINWKRQVKPVCTVYKLVTIQFKMWIVQSYAKSYLFSSQKRLLIQYHRRIFCWIDEWYGLTMNDIRKLERKTNNNLEQQRNKGSRRGINLLGL